MTSGFIRLLPGGDPETGMQASHLVDAGSFSGSDQTEVIHDFFAAADGSLSAGVWQCAPCLEEFESYPVNEIMSIISGSVTLTDPDGKAETFTAGDTLFVPKGAKLTWQITETLHKYYMSSA
ncbi:MAG: cupin domain-containing protein [Pseudomonadota bacterium]